MPDGTDATRRQRRAEKLGARLHAADGPVDVSAAAGLRLIGPRVRPEKRLIELERSWAAASGDAAVGIGVIGRADDVAVAGELFGHEQRLDAAAPEPMRENH
jgi:hypothetical protein